MTANQRFRRASQASDERSRSSDPTTAPAPNPNGVDSDQHERILKTDGEEAPASDLLELLDDDHAQQILDDLEDDALPARDLVDACDASRATVYRRLKRLEEHGLVTTDVRFHADGHHRKVFKSTFERATIELVDGTPQVRLVLTEAADDQGADEIPRKVHAD